MCPPPEVPHLIYDYPYYYDLLYFPQFHLSPFNNPQTFCHWLASALNNRHETCHHCIARSCTKVSGFYDGIIVTIASHDHLVSMYSQTCEGHPTLHKKTSLVWNAQLN